MFEAIKRKAEKVKALNQDAILTEILNESDLQKKIVDLNQEQLYEGGIQADGTPTGDYSGLTIYGAAGFAGKIEKGQRYDHITLRDTGQFYDSMQVKSLPDAIVIKANDPHNLQERFPHMLGLDRDSINEIIPTVKTKFLAEVRKRI